MPQGKEGADCSWRRYLWLHATRNRRLWLLLRAAGNWSGFRWLNATGSWRHYRCLSAIEAESDACCWVSQGTMHRRGDETRLKNLTYIHLFSHI
jgi:hypothetical protein